MAIGVTLLTGGSSSTNASSYATASFTPDANQLVLVAVRNAKAAGLGDPPSSLTGNGLTYVQVAEIDRGGDFVLTVWRAMGAAPSAGALTISFPATQTSCMWSVVEFSAVDTSGSNGSGAVVQSLAASDDPVTSLLLTLASFASTDDVAYGAFGHSQNETTTVGSGFTALHNLSAAESNSLLTEWKANDNTVDASWVTSKDAYGIALEVKVAPPVVVGRQVVGRGAGRGVMRGAR